MTQHVIEITSPRFVDLQPLQGPADWPAIFGNDHPLALEIGCGTGNFVVELAQRHPEVNYLAIDIYNKGCYKTCRKADALNLNNVRVARDEARHLLLHHLQQAQLCAIYINCPDPWPKKRHRKRRLVNDEFLRLARHFLRPGGDFFFSSDVADYAEDVAGVIAGVAGLTNRLDVPIVHRLEGYPLSKYMRKFMAQGQNINFIHHRKDEGFVDANHPLPEVPPDLRFLWEQAAND